jgi:glycosyltransferase involved in cell wall biosynthesis
LAAVSRREGSRRLRVLLVAAAGSTTGGGEKHIADLLPALPRRGVDVALVCPEEGDLARRARALGVPVFTAPIDAGFTLAKLRAVHAAVSACCPDVVHAHGSRASAFARLADPHARRRVLYHVHGIHADRAGSASRRAALLNLERLLRPRTARFVTVCYADAARGVRLGVLTSARTLTVHNGIAWPQPATPAGRFRAELGLGPGVPLVLSVGRFHEQKDQATLLRAWRRVAVSQPDAVLALVGSGGLDGALRELAAALGIAGSVRFVPPRPGLAEAYADADVFALSSRWEGLPYVLLEAMAHGLPVVGTAVDGVPEAVADGSTGVLVPPGEAEAFGKALESLLADPQRRHRLGEAGRLRVSGAFTLEQMVGELVAVYQEVARDRA